MFLFGVLIIIATSDSLATLDDAVIYLYIRVDLGIGIRVILSSSRLYYSL